MGNGDTAITLTAPTAILQRPWYQRSYSVAAAMTVTLSFPHSLTVAKLVFQNVHGHAGVKCQKIKNDGLD